MSFFLFDKLPISLANTWPAVFRPTPNIVTIVLNAHFLRAQSLNDGRKSWRIVNLVSFANSRFFWLVIIVQTVSDNLVVICTRGWCFNVLVPFRVENGWEFESLSYFKTNGSSFQDSCYPVDFHYTSFESRLSIFCNPEVRYHLCSKYYEPGRV